MIISGHVRVHVNLVNVASNVKRGKEANVSDTQHCHCSEGYLKLEVDLGRDLLYWLVLTCPAGGRLPELSCPTCWTGCTADPLSPKGGGYLQETPMLKLAWVLNRY